jgi:hypothetical protein
MIRALAEPLVFFMIPFGLYAGFLVAQLINPFEIDQWTRRVVLPLALAGMVLAVGSLVAYGLLDPGHKGAYEPAHIENGQIVPGRMK